jgi:predicted CoA-binding protein
MSTTRAQISSFLAHRRIAVVGVSRDSKHFSRYLFHELTKRGFEVVPVNPNAKEVEGQRCFSNALEIIPPVEVAVLMTPPRETERVVHDCAQAGIRQVWMHSGGGQGSVSPAAVEFCREQGIGVIEGHCPLMFLPEAQAVHRIHGFVLKIFGRYPSAA